MELIEEKIQLIAKEISEANANTWTITKIIKELNNLNTTSEKKLRNVTIKLLNELDPKAAQIYETFCKMKVYTSKETLEHFNRGHIIKSLLKETKISRSVAEKITIEVENKLKDSKIDYLTTGLIRELVNSKLIEYGFENIRHQYTRLGNPVQDIKKQINEKPISNIETKEFALLNTIPKKIRELHYTNQIFIEDLNSFNTKPYAYNFVSERYDSLEKTILKNFGKAIKNKKYFSLQPTLSGLNYVSGSITKNDQQIKKTAKLIKNTKEMFEEKIENYFELYTTNYLEKYSEFKLNAAKITNQTIEPNDLIGVDSKYCLKLLEKKDINLFILNNSKEEYFPLKNNLYSKSKGLDMFVNINLEKLAQKDENYFIKQIIELTEHIKQLKKIKQNELKEKKYLKNFTIDSLQTGIGLTNILEISKNFENKKAKEFGNKILKIIQNELGNEYILFGLGSELAKKRFSKEMNKTIFSHDQLDFEECIKAKKCCLTAKVNTIKNASKLIEKNIKLIKFKTNN